MLIKTLVVTDVVSSDSHYVLYEPLCVVSGMLFVHALCRTLLKQQDATVKVMETTLL